MTPVLPNEASTCTNDGCQVPFRHAPHTIDVRPARQPSERALVDDDGSYVDECGQCCASWDESMDPWHYDWCPSTAGRQETASNE